MCDQPCHGVWTHPLLTTRKPVSVCAFAIDVGTKSTNLIFSELFGVIKSCHQCLPTLAKALSSVKLTKALDIEIVPLTTLSTVESESVRVGE
jgi:hypothetical protein